MKVLIVDFHAGCIQSLALTLEDCGATVSVLSLSQHNFIFDPSAARRWALDKKLESSLRRKLQLGGDIRGNVATALRPVRAFGRPQFDLVVAMFPPSLAIRLYKSGIARHTLMLSAHRADLHIRSKYSRKRFWSSLPEFLKKENFHIGAASAFDQAYIDSFLGKGVCDLYELTSPHIAKARLTKIRQAGTLVFGAHRLSPDDKEKFLDQLKKPIHIAEQCLTKGYTYEELLSYEEFAYVPYSSYSISLLELELSGRPVTVPDDESLIHSHSLNDVRLWPLYTTKKRVLSFDSSYRESLNLDNDHVFLRWLQWSQWHQSRSIQTLGPGCRKPEIALEDIERHRRQVFKLFLEGIANKGAIDIENA